MDRYLCFLLLASLWLWGGLIYYHNYDLRLQLNAQQEQLNDIEQMTSQLVQQSNFGEM